ncbi:uncharacterized protein METZ01_LOCUS499755, partial [marine metagenome]
RNIFYQITISLTSIMPYSYGNFIASPNQDKTINHPPAPLMILAGAGTGKTATLLHRIRHLIISESVQAKNVVLLTFTEKATAEAQNTLKSIMGDPADSIFVGTFHSFCHSIMRRFGPENRLNDVLWDNNDALYYLINHFDDMDFIRSRVFSENPMSTIQNSFIPFFGRVSDELLSINELEKKINNFDDSQDWINNNFPGIHPYNTKFEDIPFQLRDLVNAYSFYKKGKVDQQAL